MDELNDFLEEIVEKQKKSSHIMKSLLLIDSTRDEYTKKFFEKSSEYVILDGKTLHRKKFVRKTPLPTLLDECRHLLVYAMLRGKTLVIRLGEIAVDFMNTFCDESCEELNHRNPYHPCQDLSFLPRGFLLNNGQCLHSVVTPSLPHGLMRKDDLEEIKEHILARRNMLSYKSRSSNDELENDQYEKVRMDIDPQCLRSMEIKDLKEQEIMHPNFRVIVTTTLNAEKLEEMLFNGKFGIPGRLSDFIVEEVR
jgi:hypothetical protein